MAKSVRRLGRGLESLVPDLRASAKADATEADAVVPAAPTKVSASLTTDSGVAELPTDALAPNPLQPRRDMSDASIVTLAASIRQAGMLQPIVVRVVAGRYEIIAGERRWQAARSLGMKTVPVVVREATDEQMLEFALIENIQREDLNAIDRAAAYRQFCTRFHLRPEEVASRTGEDRTTVVNYLRLLDLPETIQAFVRKGLLSMGHARCLLGVTGDAERIRLAQSTVSNELSVRAIEEIVRRERKRSESPRDKPAGEDRVGTAHVRDMQRRFEEAVKTKVTIREGKRKGTGRIIIEYFSLDDFERLATLLNVDTE